MSFKPTEFHVHIYNRPFVSNTKLKPNAPCVYIFFPSGRDKLLNPQKMKRREVLLTIL